MEKQHLKQLDDIHQLELAWMKWCDNWENPLLYWCRVWSIHKITASTPQKALLGPRTHPGRDQTGLKRKPKGQTQGPDSLRRSGAEGQPANASETVHVWLAAVNALVRPKPALAGTNWLPEVQRNRSPHTTRKGTKGSLETQRI